ncbi:hypothetical protein [uncultured Photobacterium sp.]|uniref:hypothetical protein n=1 Tax=uncultured Photobacterium sp. TaxID=173973 RepID=UPI002609E65A|nr:hypothetical protein [uncultured Photobacterium sp.]
MRWEANCFIYSEIKILRAAFWPPFSYLKKLLLCSKIPLKKSSKPHDVRGGVYLASFPVFIRKVMTKSWKALKSMLGSSISENLIIGEKTGKGSDKRYCY